MTQGLGISAADRRDRIAVERAVAEFRAGRFVVLRGDAQAYAVLGVEPDEADEQARLLAAATAPARLVLTGPRLTRLGAARTEPGCLALPVLDMARIAQLALAVTGHIDAPVFAATAVDRAALELARLALAIPAAIVAPVADVPDDAIVVDIAAVAGYRAASVRALTIVSRAPVPLEGAPDTEFVVFRGGEGLRDQIAVVIGRPDPSEPVRVRLHSACLTGDLFGSLTCDCGDQLRGAVQSMAHEGGGVLLYLDQEGRGNGFANKMRAYRLQADGHDTYEADEILGFGLDARRFDFAALMLQQLGFRRVRLMTNNPDKAAALVASGIAVVETIRIAGRTTAQNRNYLATKREKAGHLLD